jgi:hypothetical protein
MKTKILLGSVAAATILLAACGGGGGGSSSSQNVGVTVVDGPIKNAVVCLDKNNNGACDVDEPSGITDAAGNVILIVANADIGKYPVIALVGTDAIDADTGAVPTAYVMKTPADQPNVVSPLTTLVHTQSENTGDTTAIAAAFVKEQTGLNVSMFADYTKTGGTDAALAGKVAQVIVATTQKQTAALASEVGKADISGATITQAGVRTAINQTLLGLLPALTAAAAESSNTAAIQAAADTLVTQAGLTTSTIAVVVGVNSMTKDKETSDAPVATAVMNMFKYTDANNWYLRSLNATAADNTLDTNGLRRFYDEHRQNASGVPSTWTYGSSVFNKDDLHWNGSAWVTCALNQRSTATAFDANGYAIYNYCDKWETGLTQRNTVDITGRTLTSVTETMRAFPGKESNIAYSEWGPVNLALLGSTVMPAGSKLFYQTNRPASGSVTYTPASKISLYGATVAAGGPSGTAPCGGAPSTTFATTLEEVIARNNGAACVFPQVTDGNGTSLASNEWSSAYTIGIGSVTATPPTTYYSTTAYIRISFPGGNVINFYSCLARKSDGRPSNCTLKSTGTYTITTLGDARVLAASNPPLFAQSNLTLGLFVERGGSVYSGYKRTLVPAQSARLNMPAANAVLGQLGVALIAPL